MTTENVLTNAAGTNRRPGGWGAIVRGGGIDVVLDHFPQVGAHPAALHYLERLQRRGRDRRTVYNYANAISRFIDWCEQNKLNLEGVQPWHVEEYFDELPLANQTKGNHLIQIRAMYKYGQRRGLLPEDPTYDVELPKDPPKRPHILTTDELRQLKHNVLNDRQHMLFHVLAYTGVRRDEARQLKWDSVDLAGNTIFVVGKGAKERHIPIHPVLGELLSSEHPGRSSEKVLVPGPYGKALSSSSLDRLLQTFSVGRANFHDFRRTVASNLDANGVREGEINKIMGWAPRSIFDTHYRNIADERLQRAILQLYADSPL